MVGNDNSLLKTSETFTVPSKHGANSECLQRWFWFTTLSFADLLILNAHRPGNNWLVKNKVASWLQRSANLPRTPWTRTKISQIRSVVSRVPVLMGTIMMTLTTALSKLAKHRLMISNVIGFLFRLVCWKYIKKRRHLIINIHIQTSFGYGPMFILHCVITSKYDLQCMYKQQCRPNQESYRNLKGQLWFLSAFHCTLTKWLRMNNCLIIRF